MVVSKEQQAKNKLFDQIRHLVSTRYNCPSNLSATDLEIILGILNQTEESKK